MRVHGIKTSMAGPSFPFFPLHIAGKTYIEWQGIRSQDITGTESILYKQPEEGIVFVMARS